MRDVLRSLEVSVITYWDLCGMEGWDFHVSNSSEMEVMLVISLKTLQPSKVFISFSSWGNAIEKKSVSRRSPSRSRNTLLPFHYSEVSLIRHVRMVLYSSGGNPARKEVVSIPDCLNDLSTSLSWILVKVIIILVIGVDGCCLLVFRCISLLGES